MEAGNVAQNRKDQAMWGWIIGAILWLGGSVLEQVGKEQREARERGHHD